MYHTHIVRAHSEGPQHPSGRTSRFGSRGLLAAESLRCPLEQQQRLSRDRKAWVRPCSFCVPLVGGYLSWRSPVLPAAMSLTWEEGKKKKGEPPPPDLGMRPSLSHPHPGPGGVARPFPTPSRSAKPAILGGCSGAQRVSRRVRGVGSGSYVALRQSKSSQPGAL